jgi:predicted ATPase
MHISRISLFPERFPAVEKYPFNLSVLRNTRTVELKAPVTFFVGENGSGKSTLLKAVSRKCGIHIWDEAERSRFEYNPLEGDLHKYLEITWTNGEKPGAHISSETYLHFTRMVDEWASLDKNLMDYFGGKSLMAQSHGESFMSFFRSRFAIEGVFLLDEPETALSPGRQIEFLKLLRDTSRAGRAQFIIATHSPILLACPGAELLSFNGKRIETIGYEQTDYYRIYRDFLLDRGKYLKEKQEKS